jgi:hypothetical protein
MVLLRGIRFWHLKSNFKPLILSARVFINRVLMRDVAKLLMALSNLTFARPIDMYSPANTRFFLGFSLATCCRSTPSPSITSPVSHDSTEKPLLSEILFKSFSGPIDIAAVLLLIIHSFFIIVVLLILLLLVSSRRSRLGRARSRTTPIQNNQFRNKSVKKYMQHYILSRCPYKCKNESAYSCVKFK